MISLQMIDSLVHDAAVSDPCYHLSITRLMLLVHNIILNTTRHPKDEERRASVFELRDYTYMVCAQR
jgi:hypothetical protein